MNNLSCHARIILSFFCLHLIIYLNAVDIRAPIAANEDKQEPGLKAHQPRCSSDGGIIHRLCQTVIHLRWRRPPSSLLLLFFPTDNISSSAHLPSAGLRGLSPGWGMTWSPPALPSPSSVAASSPRPEQLHHPSAAAAACRCPLCSRRPRHGLRAPSDSVYPLHHLLIIKSVSSPSLLCSPLLLLPSSSNPQLNTEIRMLYCASSVRRARSGEMKTTIRALFYLWIHRLMEVTDLQVVLSPPPVYVRQTARALSCSCLVILELENTESP